MLARRSRECAAAVLARQGRGKICGLSALLRAIPSVCPPVEMPGFRGSKKFPPSEKSHDADGHRGRTLANPILFNVLFFFGATAGPSFSSKEDRRWSASSWPAADGHQRWLRFFAHGAK